MSTLRPPVQGEGCPDHPGPLLHWVARGVSCWACDIRWVYEDSPAHLAQNGDPYYVELLREQAKVSHPQGDLFEMERAA